MSTNTKTATEMHGRRLVIAMPIRKRIVQAIPSFSRRLSGNDIGGKMYSVNIKVRYGVCEREANFHQSIV